MDKTTKGRHVKLIAQSASIIIYHQLEYFSLDAPRFMNFFEFKGAEDLTQLMKNIDLNHKLFKRRGAVSETQKFIKSMFFWFSFTSDINRLMYLGKRLQSARLMKTLSVHQFWQHNRTKPWSSQDGCRIEMAFWDLMSLLNENLFFKDENEISPKTKKKEKLVKFYEIFIFIARCHPFLSCAITNTYHF